MTKNKKLAHEHHILWKEKREQPKWKFVLKEGVFYLGMPAFLVAYLMSIGGEFEFNRFILSLVITVIGSMFYGLWIWNSQEKRYQKNRESYERISDGDF